MQENSNEDVQLLTPTGSGNRRVREGDTLGGIARKTGHRIATLTDDTGNQAILGTRTSADILMPGDRLTIPPIRAKEVLISSGVKHSFVRKIGEIPRLRLFFLMNDAPRANIPYVLKIEGGQTIRGVTDSDGMLDEPITYNAMKGRLRLEDEDQDYEIQWGHLDPINTVRGVSQRLANLGFDCDAEESGAAPSARLRAAIKAFRQMCTDEPSNGKTDASDRLDEDLFEKLESKHGS